MNNLAPWKQWQAGKRAKGLAKAQSDEIDRWLMEESNRCRRQQDVLLIGTPGMEKEESCFVKGMKATMYNHYPDEALAEFRRLIWKNLLENSRHIVEAIRKLKLDHANRSTKVNCEYVMNHRSDTDSPDFLFLPKFAEIAQDLWTGEILPLPLNQFFSLHLANNAEYFFAEAQRIVAEDYVPSIEDIQHASEKGIVKTYFDCGQLSIRILHVHDQRSNFEKWIHLFEGVTTVMFFVFLAGYDEPSGVSPQTQLIGSLIRFKAVVNSPWLRRSSILLFLTGVREFGAKVHRVPLSTYFPEYTGGTDVNKAAKYILWRFMQLNHLGLSVYPRMVDVPDMSCTRFMMTVVRETILRNALRDEDIYV